jgi:type IV secretory pathway VirD2 relaxase
MAKAVCLAPFPAIQLSRNPKDSAAFLYATRFMSRDENQFRVRPGRSRDSGKGSARKTLSLAAQVKRAASKAGYTRSASGKPKGRGGTGNLGRGRRALVSMRRSPGHRRVTIMARIVRHKGAHFRAAPLGRHIKYLERDGVTRDGREASMFDSETDHADRDSFAKSCEDDRHHFRFIVSPEDASELQDLRVFTRELMADMAKDLDTQLEWVAVDHWNTDNPHVHVLVRGVANEGSDLIIDRGYVSEGFRVRAEERVTLELGPRNELEIRSALEKEVDAERWTSLDRTLQHRADDGAGLINLRPQPRDDGDIDRLLRGRVSSLEKLGLATQTSSGIWIIEGHAETTLRDLSERNDTIKTMHRAMSRQQRGLDASKLALHLEPPSEIIVGQLVERGLQDELAGTAYAIIDGADGRVHHLKFDSLEMTGDGAKGAIVELRHWEGSKGSMQQSLSTRSDLPLDAQINARGATWLDRQLTSREPVATGNGFGADIRSAMNERAGVLQSQGLAQQHNGRWTFATKLIETLRNRELDETTRNLAERTGLKHLPSSEGDTVNGIYRERITLSSGRFAMIDDGLGFQLVPWRPALDKQLGQHVSGTMSLTGTVSWSLGRARGLGL